MNTSLCTDGDRGPLTQAPALCILISFCLTLYWGRYINGYLPLILLNTLIILGWICIGTQKLLHLPVVLLALIFILSSSGSYYLYYNIQQKPSFPKILSDKGIIHSLRPWGRGYTALIDTRRYGRFVVHIPEENQLVNGQTLYFRANTRHFQDSEKNNHFNEKLYWRSQGAIGYLVPWKIDILDQNKGIHKAREIILAKLNILPLRTRGYLKASLLGIRDSYLMDTHRVAGTSHLLAISGFHVAVIAALGWATVRTFKCRLYLLSGLIWGYVLLAGAHASAVRAALMIQLILAGRMIGRPSSSFNGVCVAACIMLLWNPWYFWDTGWRLSVLAVLALTALSKCVQDKKKLLILTSPIIWIATAPIAISAFGFVPFAGVVINIIAIPVFSIALPLSFVLSLPTLLGVPIGKGGEYIAETIFFIWEIASNTIVKILPWNMSNSMLLDFLFSIILGFLMASASDFSNNRSWVAALLFFIFFTVV